MNTVTFYFFVVTENRYRIPDTWMYIMLTKNLHP